jgi:bacterioferritin (cytochrome b1)
MDRKYLSAQLAESIGTAQGIVEAEHKLINDGQLVFGMKSQLQEIYDEDEKHIQQLEIALNIIGRSDDVDENIDKGKRICSRIVDIAGDDPLDRLRATILTKYRLADSQELFYNMCEEMGEKDVCDIFETVLEDEEDHLDYMREQAMLMAHERITGISAAE